MKKKLTEALLKAYQQKPPAKRIAIFDAETRGLHARITPKGTVSFCVQYRAGEQVVKETLGEWQRDISLKEARTKAYGLMATRPGKSKTTMRDVLDAYLSESEGVNRPRSVQGKEMRFRVHLLPALGDVPLSEITRAQVNDTLDQIKVKQQSDKGHTIGGVGSARDARRQLSAFFNWCVGRGYLTGNPMAGLRRLDLSPNLHAGKEASDDHIRYYWLAAEQAAAQGRAYGPITQLVMLTACRRIEITDLEWDEVNLDDKLLEISQKRYKTGVPFLVPLVDTAVEILERQARLEQTGPYVFSALGKDGEAPYTGWNKAGPALARKANELYMKKEGVDEPLTYIRPNHEWRVTMATRLTQMGYTAELADRILGHLRPSMERTYNKYAFLDERREALEAWEKFVLSLNKKKTPKERQRALAQHLVDKHGPGYLEPPDPDAWKEGEWEKTTDAPEKQFMEIANPGRRPIRTRKVPRSE